MGTLNISDGTITVNLLNEQTGLHLKENGWRPAVAEEDENGHYLDMVEVITLIWNDDDDDTRAETIKQIKQLDRKARRHWRQRKVDAFVWLAASTHSETDTRYGVIKKIEMPEGLSERHWLANQKSELILVITHTIWWGVQPDTLATGGGSLLIDNQRVYNAVDASGENYVTIDAANVKGDAPALTIIKIDHPFVSQYSHIISAIARDSSELDNASLWLNPQAANGSTYDVVDSFAPDNWRIERTYTAATVSSAYAFEWDVNASDVQYYDGQYLVYCVCRADLADAIKIEFRSNGVYSTESLKTIWVPEHADAQTMEAVYMGHVNVPNGRFIPGGTPSATFTFELFISKPAVTGSDVTFGCYGVFLIPIHQNRIFHTDNVVIAPGNSLYINGLIEETYSSSRFSTRQHHTYGQYITLRPGEDNRLYFHISRQDQLVEFKPSDFFDLSLWAIPRYSGLRGDD